LRILLTGASGFVGRATLRTALAVGHEVRGVMRQGEAPAPLAQVVKISDLAEHSDWQGAMDGVDAIVHLAARVHVMRDRAADSLAAFRVVNVEGTRRLASAAADAGVRRFVFVSSVKVHGEASHDAPFMADSPVAPADAYGRSKAEAEDALREMESRSGLGVVVVRPPLVYGPGVGANFLTLLTAVSRGWPLPLGRVDNRRSLIYVDNLADLVLLAAVHPDAAGRAFMVADGPPVSTPELIRRMGRALDRPVRMPAVPESWLRLAGRITGRSAAVDRLLGSLEVDDFPTRDLLDWHQPVTADEGLRRTVDWFRDTENS
jgi:nucleoside-diphosphate-sugar epimerase